MGATRPCNRRLVTIALLKLLIRQLLELRLHLHLVQWGFLTRIGTRWGEACFQCLLECVCLQQCEVGSGFDRNQSPLGISFRLSQPQSSLRSAFGFLRPSPSQPPSFGPSGKRTLWGKISTVDSPHQSSLPPRTRFSGRGSAVLLLRFKRRY